MLYFIIFYYSFASKVVILPFKEQSSIISEKKFHKEYTPTLFFHEKYLNNIFTEFQLGNPKRLLKSFFTSENKYLSISLYEKSKELQDLEKEIKSQLENIDNQINQSPIIYDPINSDTFRNITKYETNRNYYGFSVINESISLCINLECNNPALLENFQIIMNDEVNTNKDVDDDYYEKIKNKELVGRIGLLANLLDKNNNKIFLNQLFNKGLIDSFEFTMVFTEAHKGYIYIL